MILVRLTGWMKFADAGTVGLVESLDVKMAAGLERCYHGQPQEGADKVAR